MSYTYDNAGRRTSMTASGQSQTNYTYDNPDRLTQITQGSQTVSFTYDNADRRATLTLPNGIVVSYAYDAASELTGMTYTLGANTLGNLTYAYDLTGRRISMGGTWARTNLPTALASATYDAANQLTQWGTTTLTYDANGNLTNDAINTLSWNGRNQLASIAGGISASFQYDGFARRINKTIGGVSTGFLHDGINPVQEQISGGVNANLLTGEVDEFFSRTDQLGTQALLSDALGSTLALADLAGTILTQYTYEPFGKTTVSGPTFAPFQFTGRENDGTELFYYRNRYYNPSLQRFVSEDPLEFAAGVNFYSYVGNDPIYRVDPLGLDWLKNTSDFLAGAGDSLTFGVTGLAREGLGELIGHGSEGLVDASGSAYKAGEYTEIAVELVLTAGSAGLKTLLKKKGADIARQEAKSFLRKIARNGGEMHHVNPLAGHHGGFPSLFPTGGLPAFIHSGPWNRMLIPRGMNPAIHRYLRRLERIGAILVNPATTFARMLRLAGRKD